MLSNLIYVSKRDSSCTDAEIEKILAACQVNNKELDITGVLLYSKTHFVQYLEGDYKKIMGLYDKIKTDKRHKNFSLISTSITKERLFPSWEMGSKSINEQNYFFDTDMSREQQLEFNNILSGKKDENNKSISILKKFFDKAS